MAYRTVSDKYVMPGGNLPLIVKKSQDAVNLVTCYTGSIRMSAFPFRSIRIKSSFPLLIKTHST